MDNTGLRLNSLAVVIALDFDTYARLLGVLFAYITRLLKTDYVLQLACVTMIDRFRKPTVDSVSLVIRLSFRYHSRLHTEPSM